MILKKIIKLIITLIILAFLSYTLYHTLLKKQPTAPYKAETPQPRTIYQVITASGVLEIKNLMKIGSVVSGTVKGLYVSENQEVKKGDLLAEIDPGTGTTDFEQALLSYQKSEKEYCYLERNYLRQRELFKAKQLSVDDFEKLTKDIEIAKLSVDIAKSALEKEKLNLENRRLCAVGDGFITSVDIYKGMSVTSAAFSDRPLIEIAPDITEMEIKLDIDESDIGLIHPGQKTRLTINTYPDLVITASISSVSFSPKKSQQGSNLFYKASIDIKNEEKKLRPGMSLNAKISVAKAKQVLSIHGFAFQLNPEYLKIAAKNLGYSFKQLEEKAKREMKKNNHTQRIKFVWVCENKSFIEKPIILGITNDNFFEVKSGLTENEHVIVDIQEKDEMETVYKKWFGGPF